MFLPQCVHGFKKASYRNFYFSQRSWWWGCFLHIMHHSFGIEMIFFDIDGIYCASNCRPEKTNVTTAFHFFFIILIQFFVMIALLSDELSPKNHKKGNNCLRDSSLTHFHALSMVFLGLSHEMRQKWTRRNYGNFAIPQKIFHITWRTTFLWQVRKSTLFGLLWYTINNTINHLKTPKIA